MKVSNRDSQSNCNVAVGLSFALSNAAKTNEIVEKLCAEVFNCSAPVLLADLIPHLIGLWIDRNYRLINFPAKLAGCQRNDFMDKHGDTIILRIVQTQPEFIPELLKIYEVDSLSKILKTVKCTTFCMNNYFTLQFKPVSKLLFQPVLIRGLAWLTAVNCNRSPSQERGLKIKALNMLKILRNEKPNIESYFESRSLEIIEELFRNVWEAEKFAEMFEVDVEFVSDGSTIDFKTFLETLDYIQVFTLIAR